jgi:sugar/nucleoside kinase (ribokinase family)
MKTGVFLGRSTVDLLYQVLGFPEEDTKIFASRFAMQPGGPALNAAITFSFLGGDATLVSAVGRGPLSHYLKTDLRSSAIRLCDVASEMPAPPVSSVMINTANGHRTIFNSPDLAAEINIEVPENISAPEIVLLDGFLLEESSELVHTCVNKGAVICLDGGSWKPGILTTLELTTVAICSERFLPPMTTDMFSVIRFLHDHGVQCVAITRGGKSIFGSINGSYFEIPVEPVTAIDTLGAGDILHGAFCWYYEAPENFALALQQASRIATDSCKYFGSREWMAVRRANNHLT